MDSTPFFYIVKHLESGVRYAGIRFAKNCHPSQLGVSYFTSSRLVMKRWKSGDKFIIEKIRVFDTSEAAAKWEGKFLQRVKATDSLFWFNRCNGGTSPMASYYSSELGKKEKSKLMQEYWGNPENKEKQSKKKKEFFKNNPEAKRLHSERMRIYYSDSSNRQAASVKSRAQFDTIESRIMSSIAHGGRPFRCVETGAIFNTQIEAAAHFGLCRESVRDALKGTRGVNQAGGYTFRYLEGDNRPVLNKAEMLLRKVSAISKSKGGYPIICVETGETFETQGQAAKHLGIFQSGVSKFLRGEIKHVKGYTFRRA